MAGRETKTVLLTGANGYMGTNIFLILVKKGYRVRGAVRNAMKMSRFLKGALAPYRSQIEIVETPDITKVGAFDQAVQGVDYIIHCTGPLDFSQVTINDTIRQSTEGTSRILEAAQDHAGPQLKSVVLTSSVAAITGLNPEAGHVYTEKDFPDDALKIALASKEEKQSGSILYYALKQAQEKTFWEFQRSHEVSFTMTALQPCTTFGPPIQPPESENQMNMTLGFPWKLFSGQVKELPDAVGTGSFCDVRDVAAAHVWAMASPKISNGQRYIVATSKGPVQAFADVLREAYPDRQDVIPKGTPHTGYEADYGWAPGEWRLNTGKLRSVFQHEWIPFDQSVRELAKSFEGLV